MQNQMLFGKEIRSNYQPSTNTTENTDTMIMMMRRRTMTLTTAFSSSYWWLPRKWIPLLVLK
jgi:hypothetical protein